jgi:hypothetical protein
MSMCLPSDYVIVDYKSKKQFKTQIGKELECVDYYGDEFEGSEKKFMKEVLLYNNVVVVAGNIKKNSWYGFATVRKGIITKVE